VVTHVNGTAEQFSALRVGSRNDQVLDTHHIPLEASRNESVDVLSHRDQDFASKMAAFLSAVELVLEVNGRSTIFSKQLGQFQDSSQAAVSSTR
jgi:hypothetical protein